MLAEREGENKKGSVLENSVNIEAIPANKHNNSTGVGWQAGGRMDERRPGLRDCSHSV